MQSYVVNSKKNDSFSRVHYPTSHFHRIPKTHHCRQFPSNPNTRAHTICRKSWMASKFRVPKCVPKRAPEKHLPFQHPSDTSSVVVMGSAWPSSREFRNLVSWLWQTVCCSAGKAMTDGFSGTTGSPSAAGYRICRTNDTVECKFGCASRARKASHRCWQYTLAQPEGRCM